MKTFWKSFLIFGLLFSFNFLISLVHLNAQTQEKPIDLGSVWANQVPVTGAPGKTGAIITNPLKYEKVSDLLRSVLGVFVQFATVIAAFFIIYAGFLYVTAQGNKGKVEKATEIFYNTIIGTIIILGAFVILEVINNTISQFIK